LGVAKDLLQPGVSISATDEIGMVQVGDHIFSAKPRVDIKRGTLNTSIRDLYP